MKKQAAVLGKVPLERALSKSSLASCSQTREWVLAGRRFPASGSGGTEMGTERMI